MAKGQKEEPLACEIFPGRLLLFGDSHSGSGNPGPGLRSGSPPETSPGLRSRARLLAPHMCSLSSASSSLLFLFICLALCCFINQKLEKEAFFVVLPFGKRLEVTVASGA